MAYTRFFLSMLFLVIRGIKVETDTWLDKSDSDHEVLPFQKSYRGCIPST